MGAGPPIQGPGLTLPGAEYFALAPNRSLALGPRQSLTATSTLVSAPASAFTSASTDIVVAPIFATSMGIYVVRFLALFQPNDFSGQIQINSVRMGFGPTPANNIFVDTGTPLATFANPIISQIVMSDRDLLVTGQDLGPAYPFQGALHFYTQVAVKNNDGAAAHSFSVGTTLTIHRIDGFVQ